jgi:hypothetical protein
MTITEFKTTQKAKQYSLLQLNINVKTENQILYINIQNEYT